MPATPAPRRSRRARVLATLRQAGGPLGVAEIAQRLDVHPNTARFHLDALLAAGAVERVVERPSGPGRPRTVYAPRPGMDRGGVRAYQLLAEMLLSQFAAGEADAASVASAATGAGLAWGRRLMAPLTQPTTVSAPQAVARLTALLDELGFAPERPAAVPAVAPDGVPELVRLRHCPFLELAESHGQIVCPLHLGLMRGALAELGAPVVVSDLEPFAEPDTCLVHLAGRRVDDPS